MSIGLNILGDRGVDHGSIINAVREIDGRYQLVMNNPDLARQVRDASYRVIFRYQTDDDNAQDRGAPANASPEQIRQAARDRVQLLHRMAPPDTILYLGNEPYATQRLAVWTLEAMRECDRLGRKGVIFNFSPGNPEKYHLPTFRECLEYAYTHDHILGLHEYFDVDWQKDFPYWVGRFKMWIEMMGSRTPKIIVTELGAVIGYDAHRGYKWGGVMSNSLFGARLTEIGRLYSQYGIDALIFAYTNNSASDDWHTFHPEAEVLRIINQFNQSEPEIVPMPTYPSLPAETDTRWKLVVATSTGTFTNVRSTPAVNGVLNKVGQVEKNVPIRLIEDDAAAYKEIAGVWRPVMLPDGTRGWMRADTFTCEPVKWADRRLNNSYGSNLRKAVNGVVLKTIPHGSTVAAFIPSSAISAGGYEWALVMHGGLIGWVARVKASWAEQLQPLDKPGETALVSVPYASQWGWKSGRTGMCGTASAWMILAHDRKQRGVSMPKEITVDTIADYLQMGKNSFATLVGIREALEAYGVYGKTTLDLSLDMIRKEIDAGRPMIVLLQYSHLTTRADKGFGGGHILVVVGYTRDEIICNDPDYQGTAGREVRYDIDEFLRAISQTQQAGNRPNQGILIRYYEEPQV